MPAVSETDIEFIHCALFGYPPDQHSNLEFLKGLPSVRNVTLALVNSPRYRHESRVEVPIWGYEKWVMTEFKGLQIWVDLFDRYIGPTVLDGHYEEELVGGILSHLPKGGTFVDVGANIGVYTL